MNISIANKNSKLLKMNIEIISIENYFLIWILSLRFNGILTVLNFYVVLYKMKYRMSI